MTAHPTTQRPLHLGHWSQGAAVSTDGKTILVGDMVENDQQVLRLDGDRLIDTGQRITVRGGPAAVIADK